MLCQATMISKNSILTKKQIEKTLDEEKLSDFVSIFVNDEHFFKQKNIFFI